MHAVEPVVIVDCFCVNIVRYNRISIKTFVQISLPFKILTLIVDVVILSPVGLCSTVFLHK